MRYNSENRLEELLFEPPNFNSLPEDCAARAAERMREDYAETGSWNPRDELIVLGHPNKSVEYPSDIAA